jgi:Cu+-exporting ATPase
MIDPVCGMTVSPERARGGSFAHGGVTYYFCSTGCRARFAADPAGWLASGPKGMGAPAAAPLSLHRKDPPPAEPRAPSRPDRARPAAPADRQPAVEYTCPMHPEVRQPGPGDCPLCGMALEPAGVSDAPADNVELRSMTRRLLVAAALSVPLVAVNVAGMSAGGHGGLLPAAWRQWVELLLATPVVLWAGWPIFVRAWRSVVTWRLNMFTLIGLGVVVAYGESVAALALPGVFPAGLRDHAGLLPVYFEAAAVIVTLVLLGQVLELRARERTGHAIRKLLSLTPPTARLVDDGGERDVPVGEVRAGDRLRVRPGERVPVDGVIIEGGSAVDESLMTGEATPVHRHPGDRVLSGTQNGLGSFVMVAEKVGAETLVSRIAALVADAQRSRAPIQRLADTVSSYFVPAVIAVAIATFAIWLAIGPEPRLAYAVVNAVAVLIIACPCALGLATPMSIMVASGRGASAGVLFRHAEAVERLSRVDTVVIDKTGTLTVGKPEVLDVTWTEGASEREVLVAAASLEQASEHPLASAVLAAARRRALPLAPAMAFIAVPGHGVKGRVEGDEVLAGTAEFLRGKGVDASPLERRAQALRTEGQTVVFVARQGRLIGLIGVGDPVKVSAPSAIRALKADGVRLVMLTGDHATTARAVARKLAIDDVRAEVRPEGKAAAIGDLQHAGHVVAMAGDGVNDAPALATADVGIAMGHGTDIALESASVTLVKGDLGGLVRARRLSRRTMRNIRQNLFFAFGYNLLGVPIAAGALYPVFGILLSPMIAAAAMSFSSVSVIANALRLRRLKL